MMAINLTVSDTFIDSWPHVLKIDKITALGVDAVLRGLFLNDLIFIYQGTMAVIDTLVELNWYWLVLDLHRSHRVLIDATKLLLSASFIWICIIVARSADWWVCSTAKSHLRDSHNINFSLLLLISIAIGFLSFIVASIRYEVLAVIRHIKGTVWVHHIRSIWLSKHLHLCMTVEVWEGVGVHLVKLRWVS